MSIYCIIGSVVDDALFIPFCFLFCYAILSVIFSFAIITLGKSWLLYFICPFFGHVAASALWVGLQCVIVAFLCHSHLPFYCKINVF